MRPSIRQISGICMLLLTLLIPAAVLIAAEEGPGKAKVFDWPNWRGPDRNGISRETNWKARWPEEGPKVLWKASVGTGFSSIAVSDGRAFTMGNTDDVDTVWCLDARTGKRLWKHSYSCSKAPRNYEGGPSSTPTVDGGRVYTLSKDGHLFCFEAPTGKIVWQKNVRKDFAAKKPTWGFASSALIIDDVLYLNVGSSGLALKKATGKAVWQSGKGPAGYATPVPFNHKGKRHLAIFGQNALIVVEAATGRQLCRSPWKTSYDINAADPIIWDGKAFISSGYNKGCSLVEIAPEPRTIWQNRSMRNHFNSCVLLDGYVYGFDESQLRCLDAKTGQQKWTQKGLGKGSLMAAQGRLIILSARGELVTADANSESFKQISRAKVLSGKCWTVPVLAGGRIYCRNAAGNVVCLDVKEG